MAKATKTVFPTDTPPVTTVMDKVVPPVVLPAAPTFFAKAVAAFASPVRQINAVKTIATLAAARENPLFTKQYVRFADPDAPLAMLPC